MVLKLNISDKEGKSWKKETEENALFGKVIGNKVDGKDVGAEFEGYEFEIMGGSDKSGFPMSKDVEGIGLKKVLLSKGWGMHKRPKGIRKKVPQTKGLRLRKTVRGNTVSESTVQLNLKVVKDGSKKLAEVFPDQNSVKVVEEKPAEGGESPAEKPAEKVAEAPKVEEKKEEAKAEEAKPAEAPATAEAPAEEKKEEQAIAE